MGSPQAAQECWVQAVKASVNLSQKSFDRWQLEGLGKLAVIRQKQEADLSTSWTIIGFDD
jgi:hypothetical protein